MHLQTTLFALLCAMAADAHPTPETVPQLRPLNPLLPPLPPLHNQGPVKVCELPYDTVSEAKDTWKRSGAETYLKTQLQKHGVTDWTNHLFQATTAGGKQGGSTYDCASFPNGQCPLPGKTPCTSYTPKEMFYIQIALSNLYNTFDTIYQELTGDTVKALGETAIDIKSKFGTPGSDGMLTYLTAALGLSASVAGGSTEASSMLWTMSEVMGLAASAQSSRVDVTDDLDKLIVDFYTDYQDSLKATVSAVFAGDFDKLKGVSSDHVAVIMGAFAQGSFLVTGAKNQVVQEVLASFKKLMTHSLIFKALSDNSWVLYTFSGEEKNCAAQTSNTGYWMQVKDDYQCVSISKADSSGSQSAYGETMWSSLDSDTFKSLSDDYKVDVQKAFQNILDCNGGKPDISTSWVSTIGESNGYPPCILPMSVESKD